MTFAATASCSVGVLRGGVVCTRVVVLPNEQRSVLFLSSICPPPAPPTPCLALSAWKSHATSFGWQHPEYTRCKGASRCETRRCRHHRPRVAHIRNNLCSCTSPRRYRRNGRRQRAHTAARTAILNKSHPLRKIINMAIRQGTHPPEPDGNESSGDQPDRPATTRSSVNRETAQQHRAPILRAADDTEGRSG